MTFDIYSIDKKNTTRLTEARFMGKCETVAATMARCGELDKSGAWATEIRVCGSVWNYSEAAAIGQTTILREQLENRYEMRLRRKA